MLNTSESMLNTLKKNSYGQTHPFVPKVHIFAYFSLLTLFSFYFNILMMVLVITSHLPQNGIQSGQLMELKIRTQK